MKIKTIVDVPPDDRFDNDPKNALTIEELCPLYKRKRSSMKEYARAQIEAGLWEKKLRWMQGRAPSTVYRLTEKGKS